MKHTRKLTVVKKRLSMTIENTLKDSVMTSLKRRKSFLPCTGFQKCIKTPLNIGSLLLRTPVAPNNFQQQYQIHLSLYIHRQTENFHRYSKFDAKYNKFWVIQNTDPVLASLNKINGKKSAKHISCFDFSTLYTNIPHDKLLEKLNDLVDFAFKGGNKNNICFNFNGSAYWGRKAKKKCFTKHSLKVAINHLITNCYFSVGNIVMRQKIGIPMGIDPAPFWANLFLYSYEHDYIKKRIKEDRVQAKHFHSTFRFIDDLCSINDGGEFGKVFKDIYPDELELKVEHEGNSASFLNLDIRIENNQFVYKLYDKRDAFPFSIVRMPYLCSNIPKKIFYSALVGEFLRITRATLYLSDFEPKAIDLVKRMLNQGGDRTSIEKYLLKIIRRHPNFLLSVPYQTRKSH